MLTLAISKGRVWEDAAPLLAAMGCAPLAGPADSRRLVLPTQNPNLRLIVARSRDAPTFVASGAAQAGIVGRDVLAESAPENICQPLNLRVAKCRMIVAVPAETVPAESAPGASPPPPLPSAWPPRGPRPLSVATKYPNIARARFPGANIVKLNGALELAPLVGLADAIVDLADTGKTLRENGLAEVETLLHCAALFIVNRVAARRQRRQILELQTRLAEVRPPE